MWGTFIFFCYVKSRSEMRAPPVLQSSLVFSGVLGGRVERQNQRQGLLS